MKPTHTLALFVALAAFGTGLVACDEDAIEDAIQGEESELEEEDLPNCSKIINCCAKLRENSLTPDAVIMQCDENFDPAAMTVTDNYGSAKAGIENDNTLAGEAKTNALDELRDNTQATFEPGCRCFLEETVGQVGEFVLPADCESDKDVGALPAGQMCSDVTDTLLNGGTNNGE